MNEDNKDTPASFESYTGMMPFPIVALGASAGGLEALQQFFDHMPPDSGMAFMVIQHLSPDSKSMLAEILRKHTRMVVSQVEDLMRVEPNRVYINVPDMDVAIFKGVFHLSAPETPRGIRYPIDYFFRSLAEDQREGAICIVLSGTGSDGALGLKSIKEMAGMAVVQKPEQAKYDGMPRSAIETGLVDQILTVADIPRALLNYIKQPYLKTAETQATDGNHFAGCVQKILLLIRSVTGRDFTQYRQSTIRRRIKRRMALHNIENIDHYHRYLQENHAEVHRLLKELLILVTSFFRDPFAFEVLASRVIPEILAGKRDGSPVRVWVPACATGEEALSIAMLFVEAMEDSTGRANLQVFATDIDPEAVQRARAAEYPETISADVSPERLNRFFIKNDGTYRLKSEIREMVIFAVQDLVIDPPFSRLDLISCRNVLIYMDVPLQKKILPLFHYTLNENGYLFLGASESTGEHSDLFAPVDIKAKIYKSKKMVFPRAIPRLFAGEALDSGRAEQHREPSGMMKARDLVERIVLEEYAPTCVLVDETFEALYFQGATDRYLSPPSGQPTFNIVKMVPEALRYRLPVAIQKAAREGETTRFGNIPLKLRGENRVVDVVVRPVSKSTDVRPLVLVVFTDRPSPRRTSRKEKAPEDPGIVSRIVQLEQELQGAKESLQATIEELEASNEELRSTNEEFQSTNEELQSMYEEMETAKEELQSTNEELVTVNSELQIKVDELTEVNDDINNLLASTEIGTIFLDRRLDIKRFTPSMMKLFRLIPTDIGRSIKDITSKIAYPDLYKDAESVLETFQTRQIQVQAEDGKWFSMHILPYRTRENQFDGVVITFVDITERKRVEQEMEKARIYAEGVLDTVGVSLLTLDSDLRVIAANRQFYRTFQRTPDETLNRRIFDLGDGRWDIPRLRRALERIIPEDASFEGFEIEHDFPFLGAKKMILNIRQIRKENERLGVILLAVEDVTRQTGMEEKLRATIGELEKQVAELRATDPGRTKDAEESV